MILDRNAFAQHWNSISYGMGNSSSPLWSPEYGFRCNFFVDVQLQKESEWDKESFWEWADSNLRGTVRCFSSSQKAEWWGFTDKDDISVVLLKWAH